jgi:hypothetical protein
MNKLTEQITLIQNFYIVKNFGKEIFFILEDKIEIHCTCVTSKTLDSSEVRL